MLTMQSTVTFDTHAYVKRLRSVGFTEEQSEVFADEQIKLIEARLASKQDIRELDASTQITIKGLEYKTQTSIKELDAKLETTKLELKRDIRELDAKTQIRLQELELRLTLRMGGMLAVTIGIIVGAFFTIIRTIIPG